MKKYKLIEYSSYSSPSPEFEKLVNEAIEQGWEPQGGVSVSVNPGPMSSLRKYYSQAMVKEEWDNFSFEPDDSAEV